MRIAVIFVLAFLLIALCIASVYSILWSLIVAWGLLLAAIVVFAFVVGLAVKEIHRAER